MWTIWPNTEYLKIIAVYRIFKKYGQIPNSSQMLSLEITIIFVQSQLFFSFSFLIYYLQLADILYRTMYTYIWPAGRGWNGWNEGEVVWTRCCNIIMQRESCCLTGVCRVRARAPPCTLYPTHTPRFIDLRKHPTRRRCYVPSEPTNLIELVFPHS